MLAACALLVLAAGLGKRAYDAGLLNAYLPKGGMHLPGRSAVPLQVLATLRPTQHLLPVQPVNPQFGTAGAPVTLTIFTDPACQPCRATLARTLAGLNGSGIRVVHKYWPVTPTDATSGLALVLAQQHGKTPELYGKLAGSGLNSTDSLLNLLDSIGLPLAEQRQAIIENGNALTAELEPDLELARSLNLPPPPQFFLNGYHIDGQTLTLPRLKLYIARLTEDDALLQPEDYWLNSVNR